MRTIIRIARTELGLLFFSPIAWLVLIIFTFQTGADFIALIQQATSMVKLHEPIQAGITAHLTFLLNKVQGNLYLYIPLLTMGLMSREISSGSIKLLWSSPVTVGQVVMGKYLAIVSYCLILAMILCGFTFAAGYFVHSADISLLLSGVLGLYLLICTYAAIGLLMSSLTSYQVVAAISTFVVLAVLGLIGDLWQHIALVRDITYSLSIAGRSKQFIQGLVSSKNLLYFLIVSSMVIASTILILRSGREDKPVWVKAGRYVLLAAIGLLAGYLSSRPALTWYWDLTARHVMTVSPHTQEVLRGLNGPLTITAYVNFLDASLDMGLPEEKNRDRDFFERYQRFLSHEIRMNYVYYYDSCENRSLQAAHKGMGSKDLAKFAADSKGFDFDRLLGPADIKKLIDLAPEDNHFVRLFGYGGKKSFVRVFRDMLKAPDEEEVAAGIKRLTHAPARIGFLTGHNERSITRKSIREYRQMMNEKSFRGALVNQGFDVLPVNGAERDLPGDLDVLVIADPRLPLSDELQEKLRRYIEKGGNMLIAGEPGKQALLNPLLQPLGVSMLEGQVAEGTANNSPDYIIAGLTLQGASYSSRFHSLYADSARIGVPGTAALQYDANGPFHADPLLVTDGRAWNRQRGLDPDSGAVVFSASAGDTMRSVPLALALTRSVAGRQQRIIVTGDADFMISDEIIRKIGMKNYDLALGLFSWLANGEYPIDTQLPDPTDTTMRITRKDLPWMRGLLLGVAPGMLLLGGAVLLIGRRRK